MRLVCGILVYVVVATLVALLLGLNGGGITPAVSLVSLLCGSAAGAGAFRMTPPAPEPLLVQTGTPYLRNFWFYFVTFAFVVFAVRSFCWLLFYDGDEMKVQSANNLGDLSLHLTYIKTFASGVSLWPDSPLYVFSLLRYPAGMDLFNGLFSSLGSDMRQQLAVTGLVASAATFYALFRWGGTFTVAAFLCNGGLAGAQFFLTGKFMDYQGAANISWKNLALSMFVTQRGLLYAIPVGLLLLYSWRERFGEGKSEAKRGLPTWVEYLFYATMPLFHIHTFIALSLTMAVFFATRPAARVPLLRLAVAALIPATFFTWLTTDHFQARHIIAWHWG
ncbi:MAG: hypothetical protein M3R10_06165, partial [Verrucomicrobiota bacterium]|nr:hypothetical protein [Verrucomicrobiota bacterium]